MLLRMADSLQHVGVVLELLRWDAVTMKTFITFSEHGLSVLEELLAIHVPRGVW